MKLPEIAVPGESIRVSLQQKIDSKTKPPGSLGELEQIALRLGMIQGTLSPQIAQPSILVFAGDHGVSASGVSPYPVEVTRQMVLNFLAGGAAINAFCNLHKLAFSVIDCGVKGGEFPPHPNLISSRMGEGTRNFQNEPAMTYPEAEKAITQGIEIARATAAKGANTIGFGEMGIGNTSSSSAIMATFTGLPPADCVGRGTGLDSAGISRKAGIISLTLERMAATADPVEILAQVGGFEIAHMAGAMIGAASANCAVVVDGFVSTAAYLVAYHLKPEIKNFAFFAHCSDERGHRKMLEFLDVTPLLQLSMRLGEGTGAALAIPLLQAACAFTEKMASFDSAHVSKSEVETTSCHLTDEENGKMPILSQEAHQTS
ncbi:MAG: nicotinate-nucleotide--dimethylbenzimidazole phosphoribosyltransferase [Verrucomicrobiota bacterium]|nr:nicotinate-nucleotide--dimethylbenzimidazole phosphoribosyltransferase [Verrucomicrobiota bacterium]